MGSAGPESTKVRRLKAYNRRRLATYGASTGEKLESAGPIRAPRVEDLRPMMAVGWQPTGRVAGTNGKRRA